MWRRPIFRLLAVIAGVAIAVVVYTQLPHKTHESRAQREDASREQCAIAKADGSAGLTFEGVGAHKHCSRWVEQQAQAGEYWSAKFAGPDPQVCDLQSGSVQALVYYSPEDPTQAESICAQLISQGWADIESPGG